MAFRNETAAAREEGIMNSALVAVDTSVQYEVREAAIIVAVLAWVLALGGVVIASIVLCGWRGSKQVIMDWFHGKATFVCR